MVYNTENGASLQKLPDKSQYFRKKIGDIIGIISSVQQEQAGGLDRLLELGNVYDEETANQLDIWKCCQHSYLNYPSEEAIFESNRIKEQHKTMKVQNEKVQFKP